MSNYRFPDNPESGWIAIGQRCSVGRRCLWVRFTPINAANSEDGDLIELCSGRGGDDAYARIEKDNPAFAELWHVLRRQAWSQGT